MDRRLRIIAAVLGLLVGLGALPALPEQGDRAPRLLAQGRGTLAGPAWQLVRRDCKPLPPVRLELRLPTLQLAGAASLQCVIEPLVPLQSLSWRVEGLPPESLLRADLQGGSLAVAGRQVLVLRLPEAPAAAVPTLVVEGVLRDAPRLGTRVVARLPLAEEPDVLLPALHWRDPATGALLTASPLPTIHREGR